MDPNQRRLIRKGRQAYAEEVALGTRNADALGSSSIGDFVDSRTDEGGLRYAEKDKREKEWIRYEAILTLASGAGRVELLVW